MVSSETIRYHMRTSTQRLGDAFFRIESNEDSRRNLAVSSGLWSDVAGAD